MANPTKRPLCGHSQGVNVKDGTNCLQPAPGRHPLGADAAVGRLHLVKLQVDPRTLAKTFELNRDVTTLEASAYLFDGRAYTSAIAPVGASWHSRRFALVTHDLDVVMRLRPEVLRQVLNASMLTSRGDPYANLPRWLPEDLKTQIKAGRLPKGAVRFKNPDPDWGDIVVWTGNVAVEVYMQYPSDPGFYRQRTDDARTARLMHAAYTQFNRDMDDFVFGKGMEPELARSEIRRINDEVFKLIIEGSFAMLTSGVAIESVGLSMRATGKAIASSAERAPRIRSTATRLRPVNGKVNVGGGMETPSMTNLNPCNPNSGGPMRGISNHILGGMEDMEEIFESGSVEYMMSSKVRFGDVQWAQATRSAAAVMRPGGRVEMNVWCSSAGEVSALEQAFRDAGFSNVKTTGSGAGVMLTAVR